MQSVDLQVKDKENLSSFAALGILFCFIFGFLTTHEVSIQDSLQLCAILALDLLTGAVIWILLSRKDEYSVFELLGVGVALGTSLNAIGQLVFRETILASLFNYLFLVFVVLLFVQFRSKKQFVARLSPTRSSTVLAVCTTALILLCGDRYYLWIGVLILAIALFVLIKFEHSPSSNKFQSLFFVFSLGSIALALLSSSILENFLFGPRSTTSYIGGWDGVYYEASSHSVMNFGPLDNIFTSNIKFAYYWFSDAWSGALARRANVEAWVLTTQMGFMISALLVAVFIHLILEEFLENLNFLYLSCALVATTTIIGSPSFLINQGSLSYSVAVVWLLLFFYLLVKYINFQNRAIQTVLVFSLLLIVMTKTTVAAPIFAAMSLCFPFLIYLKKKKLINLQFITTIVFSSALSLFLYFIFIKATSENKGSYSDFKIDSVNFLFGIGTGIILLDILILAIFKFGYLIFLSGTLRSNYFLQFSTLIALMSLLMSLVIRFQFSSANTFVATAFLLVTSLSIPITIRKEFEVAPLNQSLRSPIVLGAVVLGFCSGLVATFILQYFNYLFYLKPILLLFATTAPIIFLTIFSVAMCKYSKLHKRQLLMITMIVLASSMAGSYVAQSFRSAQQEFLYSKRNWNLPFEDVAMELNRIKRATIYINSELRMKDVLASNSVTDKGLLAALTGVRNYASSYHDNLWGGEEHRYIEQNVFAKDPSEKSYVALRNGCVTWFYYDKDESPGKAKSFEPYAKTKYEDEHGAVLKLSESYPLPDECFK
jgi:hypothetical protein